MKRSQVFSIGSFSTITPALKSIHPGLFLASANSDKALDVYGASTANGANAQQYASNGTYAQKWIAIKNSDGSYTFQSALAENKVIDVSGASTSNGANVQLYAANGTNAQKWVK